MKFKNILIIIFIIIGLYVVLDFRDHNFKRAVDACLAGSQKLSETKIIAKSIIIQIIGIYTVFNCLISGPTPNVKINKDKRKI